MSAISSSSPAGRWRQITGDGDLLAYDRTTQRFTLAERVRSRLDHVPVLRSQR